MLASVQKQRRCLAARLGFAYRKARRQLCPNDPALHQLCQTLGTLGHQLRADSPKTRPGILCVEAGASSGFVQSESERLSSFIGTTCSGSPRSQLASSSATCSATPREKFGLYEAPMHVETQGDDPNVRTADDSLVVEVTGLCKMLRTWESRHALVGDEGKLDASTLHDLRLVVRSLPLPSGICCMAQSELELLRSKISAINQRCCDAVRSWVPSRSRAAVNRDVWTVDRTELQRLLQQRLSNSLGHLSAAPSNEESPAQLVCPDAHVTISRPVGPISGCTPTLDIPGLGLPDLRSCADHLPDSGGDRDVHKRLARERRRRGHRGARHRSTAPNRSLPFRSETHRLSTILHAVLEHSDSDDASLLGHATCFDEMYDEDEPYLHSD